uniref:Uncharacterized protein n=1 Tax=Arundo donax TaxID=35708 RepID=A0A0A9UMA9_ARUDO
MGVPGGSILLIMSSQVLPSMAFASTISHTLSLPSMAGLAACQPPPHLRPHHRKAD